MTKEKVGRMTSVSKANLRIAEKATLVPIKFDDGTTKYAVAVERKGMRSIISNNDGPISYLSAVHARRNIKRVRPDLELTDI